MNSSFQSSFLNSSIDSPNQGSVRKKISIITEKYTLPMLQSFPEVTLIPDKINFPKTFPNRSVECKVLMGNSGIKSEEYTLSVTGDSEFSVPTNKISIPPGGTYPILVSFKPTRIAVYNGAVIFEGRYPFSLSLTGHCVPSIFEIPPPHAKCWVFTPEDNDQTIDFSNRDVSKAISVSVQTNCSAFTVIPSSFEIEPLSTYTARIKYDPAKPIIDIPKVTVKCNETEEIFEIPLHIGRVRQAVKLDFGRCIVNRILKKDFKLTQEEQIPQIPWPFSIVSNGSKQKDLKFEFTSTKPGVFSTTVKLQEFDLNLTAEALDLPFSLQIPAQFPKSPFSIYNSSKDVLRIQLVGYGIHVLKDYVTIAPGNIEQIFCDKNDVLQPGATLKLVWEDKGTIFTEEIPFKVTEITELNASSVKSSSAAKLSSESENTEIVMSKSNIQKKKLSANSHIVAFKGNSRRFPLKINSDVPVNIKCPDFIHLPRNFQVNEEIKLKLRNTGEDFNYGMIEISTDNDTLEIPVISITNTSQFEFSEEISIDKEGILQIKNVGDSPGHISIESKIAAVNPSELNIDPESTKNVKISSDRECNIVIKSCEYIVYEISQFLSGKPIQDQKLSDFLSKCRRKDLESLYEYSVVTKTVKITKEKENNKIFKASAEKLTFSGSETQFFSIMNMSSAPARFHITTSNPFISVDPLSGTIAAYSSAKLEIVALKKVDGEICIKIGNEELKIPVFCKGKSLVVSATSSSLQFPRCRPGTMRRASLKVSNKSQHSSKISVRFESPFHCPFDEFEIDGMSFVLLPVHFIPQTEGEYESSIVLETDNGTVVEVFVHGICI